MTNTYLAWDGIEYEWPPPAGWALRSDGRYWPADQTPPAPAPTPPAPGPQPAYAQPAPPAAKSGMGCAAYALIGIAAVFILGVGGCMIAVRQLGDAVEEIGDQLQTGAIVTDDASLDQDTCEVQDGRARVEGSVQNTYSEQADINISVRFLDEDGSALDIGTASAENLGAGNTAEFATEGARSGIEDGREIQCELTHALREPQFFD